MRKVAVLLGGLLAVGAPLGAHALASEGARSPGLICMTVPVVNEPVCIPSNGIPPIPQIPPSPPTLPQLPPPPNLPPPPQLPPPPNLPPLPSVPLPPIPSIPSSPLGQTQTASVAKASAGPLCNYDPARPTPPSAGEHTVTLPGGTTIYSYFNADVGSQTVTGYLGGTNPLLGTLEGGGTGSPSGVSGGIDGHSVQTGLSGYLGTSGACLGK